MNEALLRMTIMATIINQRREENEQVKGEKRDGGEKVSVSDTRAPPRDLSSTVAGSSDTPPLSQSLRPESTTASTFPPHHSAAYWTAAKWHSG